MIGGSGLHLAPRHHRMWVNHKMHTGPGCPGIVQRKSVVKSVYRRRDQIRALFAPDIRTVPWFLWGACGSTIAKRPVTENLASPRRGSTPSNRDPRRNTFEGWSLSALLWPFTRSSPSLPAYRAEVPFDISLKSE